MVKTNYSGSANLFTKRLVVSSRPSKDGLMLLT